MHSLSRFVTGKTATLHSWKLLLPTFAPTSSTLSSQLCRNFSCTSYRSRSTKSVQLHTGEILYTPLAEFRQVRKYQGQLKAAVFDWAGTIVDCGVYAPSLAFVELFENEGVHITEEEARGPMGVHKRVHIKKILELDSVKQRWLEKHSKPPTDADIERMYEQFVPTVLSTLHKYSNVIDGVSETVNTLRKDYNMKIGSTTGFPAKILNVLKQTAASQGYAADTDVAADEVPEARPCPFMVWLCCMRLGIHPIEAVVKVDDTVDGVREGLAAGSWTVGVAKTSSYMGLTEQQLEETSRPELERRLSRAYDILIDSGAHYVVDTVNDLPQVVDDINRRLALGEKP